MGGGFGEPLEVHDAADSDPDDGGQDLRQTGVGERRRQQHRGTVHRGETEGTALQGGHRTDGAAVRGEVWHPTVNLRHAAVLRGLPHGV